MRWGAHQDSTHKPLVAALRAVGVTVVRISSQEAGCPDLLVGHRSRTYLLEVKGPNTPVDPKQEKWHRNWRGAPVHVVRTPEEALEALGLKVHR
jgi:Holliday junction resolvase